MKRWVLIGSCIFFSGWSLAATLPDNMYFRAMHDEMQRALKQLRLKDHPAPYYMAYFLQHFRTVDISANMGALTPAVYDEQDPGSLLAEVFVSVGSDKQDGLGFSDAEDGSWAYYNAQLPYRWSNIGYDAFRQSLWQLTDEAYLKAAELYKKKQAYKQKKNIRQTLPDVTAAPAAHFQEEILPFTWPDISRLQQEVQAFSALGKTLPYVELFQATLTIRQGAIYHLNSRGAFAQYAQTLQALELKAAFRQPNGKTSETTTQIWLPDTSPEQLARAGEKVRQFLDQIRQAYGARSGEAYVGPVLLKPRAAAQMLRRAVLNDMQQSKPFLLSYADDDLSAGKLYKKQQVRVSSDLLALYDRPLVRWFEGVALRLFTPVDDEGVAAENLTLIENGRVKDFPLTRRPLTSKHRSNGHARLEYLYGPRERLTNVFVEAAQPWTDEQMEEKLREQCRKLGLPYGYILYDADPSGELGVQRIYTQDGRKETILNLKWDGNFFTQRDLRGALAVGGKQELASNNANWVLVTPSILLQEAELVPQEHKPHRRPFLPRPN